MCLMCLMEWQGGYRAWMNAGLPTKDSADYAASPVDVISERLSGVTHSCHRLSVRTPRSFLHSVPSCYP